MEITTNLTLWTYKSIKKNEKSVVAGEFEVLIKMTQNRARTYMATGYSSSKEDWDFEKNVPQIYHPAYNQLSNKINKIREEIAYEIKTAERANRIITPVEIKTKLYVIEKNLIINLSEKPNKIRAYIKHIEDGLRLVDNHGYANIFYNCIKTIHHHFSHCLLFPADKEIKTVY